MSLRSSSLACTTYHNLRGFEDKKNKVQFKLRLVSLNGLSATEIWDFKLNSNLKCNFATSPMQLLKAICALLFVGLSLADDRGKLEIKSTYIPTDCSIKAKKNDKIKVHYVGASLSIFRQVSQSELPIM